MSENNQSPANSKKQDLLMTKNDLVGAVESSGEKAFPANYAALANLNIAWLYMLGIKDKNNNPVLASCSPNSIKKAFLEMLHNGLSVTKKQCYLIPYNGELTFSQSYHGDELIAKRDAGLVTIVANAIYQGDTFEFEVDSETGIKKITKHTQDLKSIGDGTKIRGAYAIATFKDGRRELTVMTLDQIIMAWNQRQGNGLSPAHQKFTDEMARKTVKRRALKDAIGSSDDSSFFDDDVDHDLTGTPKTKPTTEAFDFDEHEEISSKPKSDPQPVGALFEQAATAPINGQAVTVDPGF